MTSKSKLITSIAIVRQMIAVFGLFTAMFAPQFAQGQGDSDGKHLELSVSAILDNELEECSGIAPFDKKSILALNDGGNSSVLYRVDLNDGSIMQEAKLKGKENKDWEDIAEGPDAWYIGDFGNNANGKRSDLRILKVLKSDWEDDSKFEIKSKSIKFTYEGQEEDPKKSKPQTTNWDCEGLIWFEGELHLFTKEWSSHHTRHFVLPTEPGEYKARLIEEFDAQGMITAASVTKNGKLVLLGYSPFGFGFLWTFEGNNGIWFAGDKRKYNLGSVNKIGQVEALFMRSETVGYIGSERWIRKKHDVPPTIYRFEL
jgi:hypothetical protein